MKKNLIYYAFVLIAIGNVIPAVMLGFAFLLALAGGTNMLLFGICLTWVILNAAISNTKILELGADLSEKVENAPSE